MTNAKNVIRVQARNNSDARRMDESRDIPGATRVKHNGGKTVIIESDDTDATGAWLDAAHEVASYEVVS
jgi:hypothetical protein